MIWQLCVLEINHVTTVIHCDTHNWMTRKSL
jgi:hypothetical protein